MWHFRIGAIALAVVLAAPFTSAQAAEETVICKDGSTSKGGKGACSGHGGVDKKATEAAAPKKGTKKEKEAREHETRREKEEKKEKKGESEKKAAGPSAPAEETVICKDGSTSKGGKGACSGHGGVDKKASKAGKEGTTSSSKPAVTPAGVSEETVVCKDGSTSKGGKGACSGHGGVDKKAGSKGAAPGAVAAPAPPAPVTPPPPAARPAATSPAPAAQGETGAKTTPKNTDPTGATAKCKDGTYSHAKHHSGACSNHGGVAEWLDEPAK